MLIRKAKISDAKRISEIYENIHDMEENKKVIIGWIRNVYPTYKTAIDGINKGEMFVLEDNNQIVASAKINQEEVFEYQFANWEYNPPKNEIMVLHTLTVDPQFSKKGYGKFFIKFYEDYSLKKNAKYLRIDTNAKNVIARKFYKNLGFKEVGIVPCDFNGIKGIQLVCLEKYLG